ncbi:poly [ADP-ribose] polymerase tankyrase-like [Neocloeon triangulifer]|uniref:poly [ADP-ribose] polymerase tankyrase-like n=1 Tax=Neocloeon triangulifer TaxID=2078957 RepID=UPI00286EC020|nr:poly [ADP-ribose] polymerase tankyrase-like [Neocloeon triangulifer]XP_059482670.1 poly [ADP-ribose] polymerase tankyrase-like [Neocloeon triangulifer]XP_059482671.1 poly [ADP-ribose] polymerase tankyrase-like [Neocloeon triangulifer]XP_059482672.1 poly [ADP-ribose] polymerase tankyrase-like [Neocloeon triangulifer]XP_059482673.1 poly [ADP-ribose] polymerase tankyrase-like [Neocloeon triangulifer]
MSSYNRHQRNALNNYPSYLSSHNRHSQTSGGMAVAADGDRNRGWVEGFVKEQLPPNHNDYNWIASKMHNSIAVHNGTKISKYNIVQVYKVKNSKLWNKYTERRYEMARDYPRGKLVPEIRLFHGTNHADKIVRDGFNVDCSNPNGMFGKGIYFADLSSKSSQYTFEGCNTACKSHNIVYCTSCIRKMLVCKVALGKSYEATAPMNGILQAPQGYHSVIAKPRSGFLNYSEYIVYNNYQAYPGYLIEYKVSM